MMIFFKPIYNELRVKIYYERICHLSLINHECGDNERMTVHPNHKSVAVFVKIESNYTNLYQEAHLHKFGAMPKVCTKIE